MDHSQRKLSSAVKTPKKNQFLQSYTVVSSSKSGGSGGGGSAATTENQGFSVFGCYYQKLYFNKKLSRNIFFLKILRHSYYRLKTTVLPENFLSKK